jgi:hypothetical protein
MVSSSIVAAMFTSATARHIVFAGSVPNEFLSMS